MRKKEITRVKNKYRDEVASYIRLIVESLEEKDSFEQSAMAQLDILAINLQMYFDAYDQIKKDGLFIRNDRENVQKHPAVDVMSKCFSQIAAISKSFGLTPLDLKKLESYDKQEEQQEEKSPLEEWFANSTN